MTLPQPDGYFAQPASGRGPGVLVLHAWWGLNDTVKALCTRLAEAGFVTFAPDLYHGQIADTIPDAEALAESLDSQQAKDEIVDASHFLNAYVEQPGRGVAVIGFSLGAFFALDFAAVHPDHVHSAVIFYGAGGGDFSGSRAAFLGHFAENDPYEPQSSVIWLENALRQAGREVTFHQYPGTGHWFFEPDREDAYNQAAAELAWERTLTFLNR